MSFGEKIKIGNGLYKLGLNRLINSRKVLKMNNTPEVNFEVYNGLLMVKAGADLTMYNGLETVDALIEQLREIKPAITYEQSVAMLGS